MPLVGRYPLSVCIACALHLVWAVGLLHQPDAIHATGLYTIMAISGDSVTIAAAIFAAVAVLASVGLVFRPTSGLYAAIFILPQQVVLWFSMVGAAHAMWLGVYADGVARTSWFLIVDQLPIVLIAFGHMAALLFIAAEHHVKQGQQQ